MAHTTLTLIVDGIEACEEVFVEGQEELMEAWEDGVKALGKMTPQDVELFMLHHPHRRHEDCECIQFEQSHKPKWSNHE